MENIVISNHTELILRIAQLKEEKLWQEEELKQTFKEFVNTLNPVTMVKRFLHNLLVDSEVQNDVLKVGLNLGTNFIIDKILGKNRSFKGFLSSVLVEIFSTAFINKNTSKIFGVIGEFIGSKTWQENNQQ